MDNTHPASRQRLIDHINDTNKHLNKDDLKTEITSSVFPTWENVITDLQPDTTYTAETNGFLMLGIAGGNGNRLISTIINGVQYDWWGDAGSERYGWGCMQVYLPIAKGCIYSFLPPPSNQSFRFALFVPAS